MKDRQRNAFTLVELLVVIAIIGILVGLLLPAVQSAREAARRMQCVNNLTQVALAIQNYEMAFRVYPPGTIESTGPIVNTANGYHHNWLVQILPYLEEGNTYKHVDFGVGVYHANNAPVRQLHPRIYMCPSDGGGFRAAIGLSNYAGLHHDLDQPIDADNNGVFFLNSVLRYEDISDGSTHTIFVGDKITDAPADLGWMSGTRWTLRNTGVPLNMTPQAATPATPPNAAAGGNVSVGGFGSYHPGGVNFAFGDGHVGFLSMSIDLETYQQLGHRADGKLLDFDF